MRLMFNYFFRMKKNHHHLSVCSIHQNIFIHSMLEQCPVSFIQI